MRSRHIRSRVILQQGAEGNLRDVKGDSTCQRHQCVAISIFYLYIKNVNIMI